MSTWESREDLFTGNQKSSVSRRVPAAACKAGLERDGKAVISQQPITAD